MPFLFGKNYTKHELLDRVGDVSQIGGARQVVLSGGPEDGVHAVEFRTGSGFNFLVVPGRGMDILPAEHNGRALAWRSATGETSASFYEPQGLGWLRSFSGGLLVTCGLTYAGAPCEDMGEQLGLHGRASNTPASNVWVDGEWDGDEYTMWAQGKIRETRVFGENVVMQRKVSAVLGQNKLWVHDVVTNEAARTTPHMMLYHMNGGFPAVDAGSLFVSPTRSAQPRDAEAEIDKEHFYLNQAPDPAFKERVYLHDMATDADGAVYAGLVNKNLPDGEQFGFYIKYFKRELPCFVQWKMNGAGEYTVGMEPANCLVDGRDTERARGALQFLEPHEQREYHIEVGVLTTPAEVAQFEQKVKSILS